MKILDIIPWMAPRFGGPPISTLDKAVALTQQGHQSVIYSTNLAPVGYLDTPTDRPIDVGGVPVHYFPIDYWRYWGYSLPLWRAIRRNVAQFDVVHLHSTYSFACFVGANECLSQGIPYVISPHGALDPVLRKKNPIRKKLYDLLILKKILNKADAIIYTNQEEMSLVHEDYGIKAPGVLVTPFIVLKDFIEFETRGSFRSLHPEIGDRLILLFLSRINFKKGLDLLVKAFGELINSRPDVHLVIAGPDNEGYSEVVRGWLEQEGALERVTFTGLVVDEALLAIFHDADIFVLPSYTENFGNVIYEAMASSLPVIITNKVNGWQNIQQNNCGIVIDCDAKQLTQAMFELVDNVDLRIKMGQNGLKLINNEFSSQKIIDQWISFYQSVLDLRRNQKK